MTDPRLLPSACHDGIGTPDYIAFARLTGTTTTVITAPPIEMLFGAVFAFALVGMWIVCRG